MGASLSDTGSNSNSRGVESLSRDSRRGRDVKSAEVDLMGYQPLPGSVKLSHITEQVSTVRTVVQEIVIQFTPFFHSGRRVCMRRVVWSNGMEASWYPADDWVIAPSSRLDPILDHQYYGSLKYNQ